MIKASGYVNGRPVMLFGLSEDNVTRLRAGQPIFFDATPLGYTGRILIAYGATEDRIRHDLMTHGLDALLPDPPGACTGCECGACPGGDGGDEPVASLPPGRPTVTHTWPPVCVKCGHRHPERNRCATHTWTDTCAYTAGSGCPGVVDDPTGSPHAPDQHPDPVPLPYPPTSKDVPPMAWTNPGDQSKTVDESKLPATADNASPQEERPRRDKPNDNRPAK